MSYDEDKIPEILKTTRTIAVVGISDKPDRDSYRVAEYLVRHGYDVIPVNPVIERWNGRKAYPDLKSIPGNIRIDVVDIFRKPDAVPGIIQEASEIKPRVIWMQEGVVSNEGASAAKKEGMTVVMDRCIMKEHVKMSRS
jgi:predicted CoA-binding protein